MNVVCVELGAEDEGWGLLADLAQRWVHEVACLAADKAGALVVPGSSLADLRSGPTHAPPADDVDGLDGAMSPNEGHIAAAAGARRRRDAGVLECLMAIEAVCSCALEMMGMAVANVAMKPDAVGGVGGWMGLGVGGCACVCAVRASVCVCARACVYVCARMYAHKRAHTHACMRTRTAAAVGLSPLRDSLNPVHTRICRARSRAGAPQNTRIAGTWGWREGRGGQSEGRGGGCGMRGLVGGP